MRRPSEVDLPEVEVSLAEPWSEDSRRIVIALTEPKDHAWPLGGTVTEADFDPRLVGWRAEVSPRHASGENQELRTGMTVAVGVSPGRQTEWTYLGFGRARLR